MTMRLHIGQAIRQRRPLHTSIVGSAAIQGLGVVTGILLARGLGPEPRGAFAAMVLWPTLMVTVGDLGLIHSFSYFTARGRRSPKAMMALARRAAFLQSLYLLPLTLLVSWLGLRAAHAEPLAAGLVLAGFFIPGALLSRFVASVFQGELRMASFFAIRLSMDTVIAIVLLIALFANSVSVWTVAVAYICGLVFMIAVSLILPYVRPPAADLAASSPDENAFSTRAFVGYGLRALPGTLYPVEGLFLDQLLVGIFLGPHDLGLYVCAIAFTSLPRLLAFAVGVTAMPTVAKTAFDRQRAATWRFIALTTAIVVPVAGLLILLMPDLLPLVFGDEFARAVVPAQILVAGSAAFGVRQVIGQCLRGQGRPGTVSVVETAGWPFIVVAAAGGAAVSLTAVAIALLAVQTLTLVALATATSRPALRQLHRPGGSLPDA